MLPTLGLVAWIAATDPTALAASPGGPQEAAGQPSTPPAAVAAPAQVDAVRFEKLEQVDRVEGDGVHVRTLDLRVRLGNAQGVAAFGQAVGSYVDGFQEVVFEDVEIRKPDGRRVPVKDGLVEDLNPFGVTGTSTPADVRYKKLTIPGLEPGDVLAYRMVSRRKPLSPGRVFGEMKLPPLPGGHPQTYVLDLPRRSEIRVRLREGLGASWEEVPATPDRLVRRLTLKVELPPDKATKGERTSWLEPDVMFSNFGSWADVTSWWWSLSKSRLQSSDALALEAQRLASGSATPSAKVAALHAFVAQRIRYLNVSFGLGRMQPRPAADVLQNRFGDCKDKHALLGALAAGVGLDVRPVLVNSAGVEMRDDVPGPQQFDHMISVVRLGPEPAQWLWLDTTNPFAGPGQLSSPLRDKRALLVEADGGASVVRTPRDLPFVPTRDMTFKGQLAPDGTLRGRTTWVVHADVEPALRAVFATVPQERRAAAVKEGIASSLGELTVENVIVSDPLDLATPLRIEFDATRKDKAGARSLEFPVAEVDLPKPDDSAGAGEPVAHFGLREVVARGEIELPEGLQGRAPLSVALERPFGSYRSTYTVEGRTLRLERRLSLKQDALDAADVSAYEAFRKAVDTDHEQEFAIQGVVAGAGGAESLRAEGVAALDAKDYSKAVELLQRATSADAKVKDGFRDLGRALFQLKRDDDAIAAFTRQVEVDAFHEDAYAWRAHALTRLNRWAEAEKDLEKQIEVAPFKVWSYEKLGERRYAQGRFVDAADLYARAAAIEPKKAERWIDLGDAQARADHPDDARRSLETGLSLSPADWLTLRAAKAYRTLGDLPKAGEMAESAATALGRRSADLVPGKVDEGDLYWTERLVEAWHLVGVAAIAANDPAKAERFLEASWRLGFAPEAAWAIGELREKEGKLAQAVQMWAMAAAVPNARYRLPKDHRARLDAAVRKLAGPARDTAAPPWTRALNRSPQEEAAATRLMELRTVRIPGPVATDLSEDVVLLTDLEGRIERILNVSRRSPVAFDRQVARLGGARVSLARPGGEPIKTVRRALLACASVSGCALVLDLPGVGGVAAAEAEGKRTSSFRIVSLEPKEGTTLAPGASVAVTAKIHYEIEAGFAVLSLGAVDEAGQGLVDPPVVETVATRSGEAELKASLSVPAGARRVDVLIALTAGERPEDTVVLPRTFPVKGR